METESESGMTELTDKLYNKYAQGFKGKRENTEKKNIQKIHQMGLTTDQRLQEKNNSGPEVTAIQTIQNEAERETN